ncbi:MAG: hypothetical protein WBE89_05605, partial [Methyloceanibacter sp.]
IQHFKYLARLWIDFVCPNIRSSARTTSPTWLIAIAIGSNIYGGCVSTIVVALNHRRTGWLPRLQGLRAARLIATD